MTCHELARYLSLTRGEALPPEAAAHLAGCERCRALFEALGAAATGASNYRNVPLPASLLADLRPVRPLPPAWALMLISLIPVLIGTTAGLSMWGTGGWHAQTMPLRAMTFSAICGSILVAAYGLSRQMIPGSLRRFPVALAGAVAGLLFVGVVVVAFHQQYNFDLRSVWRECFVHGLGISAVTFVLALIAGWRGAWLNKATTLLVMCALAGSTSLLVLTAYCPVLNVSHVLWSHVAAVLLFLFAGWLTGRIITWR